MRTIQAFTFKDGNMIQSNNFFTGSKILTGAVLDGKKDTFDFPSSPTKRTHALLLMRSLTAQRFEHEGCTGYSRAERPLALVWLLCLFCWFMLYCVVER